LVVAAAAVPGLATVALPAVATAASSNGQGAAMLLLLLVLAALAAGLEARARPAPGRLEWMRPAAIGALVLALAVTGFAVGRREHGPGRDTPAASPTRLASVQSNRYAYWRVALRTFGEHPLRGVGSGGFAAVWLRERPFAEPVRDAHSLYLETAAELGVVGLALLALVIGGVAAAARRVGPALPGATAARWAVARHAPRLWDWELPALSLVALLLAALLLTSREAGGALDGRAP
jgi:O-antigen ligase